MILLSVENINLRRKRKENNWEKVQELKILLLVNELKDNKFRTVTQIIEKNMLFVIHLSLNLQN